MSNKNKRATGKIILVAAILIAAAIALLLALNKNGPADSNQLTFNARRGPLVISITESGTIEARNNITIKNTIPGTTTILWIIDEGSHVKKGDLLVRLDDGDLQEDLFARQIKVQNAEASFMRTKENLVITKNQAESDIAKAETTLLFAREDYKKYVEGEYPQSLKEAQARITLAEEELQRAREKLKWSQVLFKQKLISQTELQADELAAKHKEIDLQLEREKNTLLEKYTHKRELAKLKSDIKQAEMALERVQHVAKANIMQTEIDLSAKESEYKRQKEKLEDITTQIEATKIYAPADGLVLYATSSGRARRHGKEPFAEGIAIHDQEPIIYLPDTSKMMASIKIHETNVKKLSVNMPAGITVDALPGMRFQGHVNQIAPLPDPTSFWINPDLKVYNTEVYIDGDPGHLRSGMTCEVEIIAKVFSDTIYIPIQSVVKIHGTNIVYVISDGKPQKRTVSAGPDNGRMIRITSGLKEGEQVLLTPPLPSAEQKNNNLPIAKTKRHRNKKHSPVIPVTEKTGAKENTAR